MFISHTTHEPVSCRTTNVARKYATKSLLPKRPTGASRATGVQSASMTSGMVVASIQTRISAR